MPKQKKKFISLPYKQLGRDISKYPFVEIRWVDIEGDDGWSTLSSLDKDKLPVAVSKGYLLSQKKGVTRIFRDYIESKEGKTFEDPDALEALLSGLNINNRDRKPTLVKFSVDTDRSTLEKLVEICESHSISGYMATNTSS